MKISGVLRDAAVMAVAFLGLQTLQAHLLKDALTQLDHMSARRLESAVAGLLNKAHKAKDDIAIVQILEAINQAPGVVQAQILDPEIKGIVGPKMYSHPLKEGAKKWGNLTLSLSDHLRRKLVRRQWLVGTGSTAVICALIFLYLQFLARRNAILKTQTEELHEMLQAAERKTKVLVEREQVNAAKAMACLQQAVERIAVPMMVLDSQQRVAAINAGALSPFGFARAEDALLKSWHEVPLLQTCGALLEQSLQSPMSELQAQTPIGGPLLSLTTLKDGSGTWVTLFPSKRIVE